MTLKGLSLSGLQRPQRFSGNVARGHAHLLAQRPPFGRLRAGLGSTTLLTNSSQQVIARRWYRPYGEERCAIGALPTDRLFTGQRWDSALGLLDYRARYYDPLLGRFINADTLVPAPGNPQALNRYAYVDNNPLRYTDPTGHFA